MEKVIKTVKTKRGVLKICKDTENDSIYIKNPITLARYRELTNSHPDCDKHGIFWAFSNKQFEEGKAKMKELGLYTDGQKIYSIGWGGYGVNKELIDKYFSFYENRKKTIAQECEPQEVYLYEWSNHECGYTCDDTAAFAITKDIFGKERASKVERFYKGE